MNYVFCKVPIGSTGFILKTLQKVEDDFEFLRGVSRIADFPADAYFEMNDDFPNNLSGEDFLFNENKLLVVSSRVLALMTPEDLEGNEVLPVRVINHKGREIKESYSVLHQVDLQDCIDLSKSIVRRNAINPEIFARISKLVLDENKISSKLKLFRIKGYAGLPIVKRELAERVESEGLTGIRFGEIDSWTGR